MSIRVTLICPEALIDEANHLAMVLGYSAADIDTYGEPRWQDDSGNLYTVASTLVFGAFVENATSALERPEWDTDNTVNMAAANRAQSKVSIWGLSGEEEDDPVLDTEHILALFHPDPHYALGLVGVKHIEEEAA